MARLARATSCATSARNCSRCAASASRVWARARRSAGQEALPTVRPPGVVSSTRACSASWAGAATRRRCNVAATAAAAPTRARPGSSSTGQRSDVSARQAACSSSDSMDISSAWPTATNAPSASAQSNATPPTAQAKRGPRRWALGTGGVWVLVMGRRVQGGHPAAYARSLPDHGDRAVGLGHPLGTHAAQADKGCKFRPGRRGGVAGQPGPRRGRQTRGRPASQP